MIFFTFELVDFLRVLVNLDALKIEEMKILYYECFAGMSGDMNLGAMIDLGVPFDHLKTELERLGLTNYTISQEKKEKKGITGIKVNINYSEDQPHRHLTDIEKMIRDSSLKQEIKDLAIKIFRNLGEAEAIVHGIELEKVHFHEVGAVDSICDIVGAAICFDYLHPGKVISTPVEVGSGYVNAAHGRLPVPPPATSELLKGIPVTTGNIPFEATTPTGAAILKTIVDEFSSENKLTITDTGYGLATKDAEIPNLLRASLCETSDETGQQKALMIECNIDDMNPEYYDFLFENLFSIGADDVFLTPVMMKKNRPAHKLSVLCKEELAGKIRKSIFENSSTIGMREFQVRKYALERKEEKQNTTLGTVRVKKAFLEGRIVQIKPEYDDVKKIAEEKNLSIKEVYTKISKEIE